MAAYYNELDAYAAQWLRNLIAAGLIADGEVDERPIQEVQPEDVRGFTQCHWFAGIGGWSYAARLAGWPDDRPLWTGSCPCQPFSVAGRRKGVEDERHLWPHLYRLVRASRPAVLMGEQTSGALGYAWLDGVGSDLEAEAYAWRAVDIPACGVNAPQIRNRIYWLASTESNQWNGAGGTRGRWPELADSGAFFGPNGIPNPNGQGLEIGSGQADQRGSVRDEGQAAVEDSAGIGGLVRAYRSKRWTDAQGGINVHVWPDTRREEAAGGPSVAGEGGASGLGSADGDRRNGQGVHLLERQSRQACVVSSGSSSSGFWDDWVLIGPDPEGKYRRIESGLAPLVTGVSGRVAMVRTVDDTQETHEYSRIGAIRGFGNAICAPLAAEVIRAYMEAIA